VQMIPLSWCERPHEASFASTASNHSLNVGLRFIHAPQTLARVWTSVVPVMPTTSDRFEQQ